jgi:hypothetical protein
VREKTGQENPAMSAVPCSTTVRREWEGMEEWRTEEAMEQVLAYRQIERVEKMRLRG